MLECPGRTSGLREYAVYRWTAERWHQIEDVVRDVGVSGALPTGERPG